MAGCCDPRGCDQMFGNRFARHVAKRYRRRGLDATATTMVDFLSADGLEGATVLEIGGGVGEIGVELLRRGAASATTVELSDAYDQEARRVAEAAGVADRVQRQLVDVAVDHAQVAPADLVVLHRVVCCYPDHPKLLGAAANLCRRRLAFSHPPRNAASRAVVTMQNLMFRVTGKEFRTFAHPPESMLAVLVERGLRPVMGHRGRIWHAEGLTR